MKQLRLPIFTSKIKYYNLRIVPPALVYDQVMELKKEFESLYGKQPLSGSKPHITLAAFKMNSKHQDLLIQGLGQLGQKEPFTLDIDQFDVFEGSRTLFLNVSKNQAIEGIHRDVQMLRDDHLKRKLKAFFISDSPHMTLSKTTGKKMLYESLQHFQKSGYSEQIEVNQLTLVSRSKYRTWDWEHHIGLSKKEL